MLGRLNRFIIGCSESWWKFLLLFVGFNATMFGLQQITARFPDVTAGDIPFDMQNELTPAQIFAQLDGYTDQAFELYSVFQAIDYVFPVVAGLFLAAVCAFALRHAAPALYQTAADKNLFLLLLVPTAFDFMENFSLLRVVAAWPEQAELAATMAVAAKFGKLSSMNVAFVLTGTLLLWAATTWLRRRLVSPRG
jgi:hypothetical protein